MACNLYKRLSCVLLHSPLPDQRDRNKLLTSKDIRPWPSNCLSAMRLLTEPIPTSHPQGVSDAFVPRRVSVDLPASFSFCVLASS